MTKKRGKKKSHSILVLILVLVILGGCGYAYYYFFMDKNNDTIPTPKEKPNDIPKDEEAPIIMASNIVITEGDKLDLLKGVSATDNVTENLEVTVSGDYDTNKPLPDTVIEIYNELDELMYHEITNQDGKIIIENIPYGKYYFKEIKAPDGYTIDNDKYYFEIKEDNEVISANMKNERIPVPNNYLNDKNVAYIISLCLIIIACFLLKNKRFYLKILAIFLVTIAITIPIYQNEKQVFITKTIEAKTIDYIKNTSKDNKTSNIDPNTKPIYNYIAVLEIPKINLKQGLVNKYSKYNNVKYNIEIIDGSNYPNINGTNFILAAHSGTSKVAYFKDLNKLTDDDIIYLYYLGNKYTYKINKHYEVLKTGYIDIERDRTVNAITLITCKDDDYQLVYLGYLINIETY